MLRIGWEMNAKHPRRRKFLIDLSHAIFIQHEGDRCGVLSLYQYVQCNVCVVLCTCMCCTAYAQKVIIELSVVATRVAASYLNPLPSDPNITLATRFGIPEQPW